MIPYHRADGPLNLLVDSTGIKFLGDGEWQARKNGRPWKEDCPDAVARNETLRATRHYGRAFRKRWTRELGFAGAFHDSARYVELLADFIGEFHDVTDEPGRSALHLDPAVGYPEGQSLAQHLRREVTSGLIYPSVRAPTPGCNCLVCIEPQAIQNVRPGASWDLVWNGTPDHSINAVG